MSRASVTAAICDRELRYAWISGPVPGGAGSDILGRTDEEVFPAEALVAVGPFKRRVLQTGAGDRAILPFPFRGATLWYDLSAEPLYDEHGSITGLVLISLDVTEHENSAAALRNSEARFEKLSSASREGIALHNGEVILECNQTFARMFGYTPSDVVGIPPVAFIAPEARDVALAKNRAKDETPYESIGLRKDGT